MDVIPQELSILLSETGSQLNLQLAEQAKVAGQQAPELLCLSPLPLFPLMWNALLYVFISLLNE